MVRNEVQKLLDWWRSGLVRKRVVDMDDDLLEVIFFLLPLQGIACCLACGKVLIEGQNCKVLKVVDLQIYS